MKYLRTLLLALQSEFQYRANLVGWFIVGIIPAITLAFVWLAILGEKTDIGGFSKGDFIVYYFFMSVGWYLVGGTFGYALGTSIKNGSVNITLLKPYNIALDAGVREQAWKIISLGIALPITAIFFYLFKDIIHINLSLFEIALLIISLMLGGIIFALVEAIVGLGAFWVTESWPLVMLKDFTLSLLGARLIPFTLMPIYVQFVANILPFKYMFYVPLSILLKKAENPLFDVLVQGLFVIILFLLYKFIWNCGIRRYEAIGG